MKAVLVLDEMPKSCRRCRLYRAYEFRQMVHCEGNFREIHYGEGETERPSWCPLRPFNYKFGALGSVINPQGITLSTASELLDEITGEKK